jgi:phosphoribosylformimino-5-aminoimidazole carboxamide ribotide isomerase
MSEFNVYPAIDLRGGRVVRLVQGDPKRQTVFSDDPAAMARRWIDLGAGWLHLVNLDGAFEESDNLNRSAIEKIVQALEPLQARPGVQLGGGLRKLGDIEQALAMGIDRVILGTAAVLSPEILKSAVERFSSRQVAVALDVSGGRVMLRGWMEASETDPFSLCKNLVDLGVTLIIYTDVNRDGTGAGLDLPAAASLAEQTGLSVIVSGGVGSLADVRQAKASGLSGVIIGRALYDGAILLPEALAC